MCSGLQICTAVLTTPPPFFWGGGEEEGNREEIEGNRYKKIRQ